MMGIDLNCDMGESFGNYEIGMDEKIMNYVSSANLACGYHAGDPNVMAERVKMAKEKNVEVGAHPGYPDLMGFGRREMDVGSDELKNYITYQIGALNGFLKQHGMNLQHVKPHGALYNSTANDEDLGRAIVSAILDFDDDVILVGLSGSKILEIADEMGLKSAAEVFADRAYNSDKTLVSRKRDGAVIHDEEVVEKRVIKMVEDEAVETIDGEEISIEADTVCVHGDNPEAVALTKNLKDSLEEDGITVESMNEYI